MHRCAKVCAGARRCAQVCSGVLRCAQVNTRVNTGVRRCAQVDIGSTQIGTKAPFKSTQMHTGVRR